MVGAASIAGRLDLGHVRTPAHGERGVGDVLLHRTDGHRAKTVVEGARTFAQAILRAHPATDFRQGVGLVGQLGGLEDALNGAASLACLPSPPRLLLPRRRFSISEFIRNQFGIPGLAILRPELPVFKTPLYLMD